jgi:hypothetical protein
MDFFEPWFGVSLDGGSGMLEALYIVVPLGLIAGFAIWRYRRSRDDANA